MSDADSEVAPAPAPAPGNTPGPDALSLRVREEVKRVWGYDTLRPLQAEAIRAGVDSRDSLVVMPTGGGKSLCYQVPPLINEQLTVVISPLIALMKDQIDALKALGYPAAALHSGLGEPERRQIAGDIRAGRVRLVLVAPERLMSPGFLEFIAGAGVHSFAVDEAHCISHWGHDFRPEYRQLAVLKQRFPDAAVHAYTATATPRVREDILSQLNLVDPAVLVGTFDRPNLIYRILPLDDVHRQVLDVLQRHRSEAAIVYCISRKDTESLAAYLRQAGLRAGHYHAGMKPEERRKAQEAFSKEEVDVIVATVAFGMGIDRSNVRCVIHAAMPKSLEAYQQETGRAGRDGLEAECVLFYSAGDAIRWQSLMEKSAAEAQQPPEVTAAQLELLAHMQRLCSNAVCRHKTLSEYFGQDYEKPNCGACDSCLQEVDVMADSLVVAQKIISAVARVEQRFGIGHVSDVLTGADTEMVRKCGHERLSTYGLLRETPKKTVTALIYQLVDQGLLGRTAGDRPIVHLTPASRSVLKGERKVALLQPKRVSKTRSGAVEDSWEGVDRDLFEHLRVLRREIADAQGVPPFVIFSDVTLRELARMRPSTTAGLRRVRGIGEKKSADLGPRFLEAIKTYCREHQLTLDQAPGAEIAPPDRPRTSKPNSAKDEAFRLFAQGRSRAEVAAATGRAASTVCEYLAQFIAEQRPAKMDAWVDADVYAKIVQAARQTDTPGLKPLFESLGGQISYDDIRLVLAHVRVMHG